MDDPIKQFASLLDMRMASHANRAVIGVPCELGTITASGLKLDSFKHEINDYLVADWEIQLEIPQASRVIQMAAPVESDGSDIPEVTSYSTLTRFDFRSAGDPTTTIKVHLNLKEGIKPGDRVLAVPINGGQDAVVIAKVVS
jgi:hypothetical protein